MKFIYPVGSFEKITNKDKPGGYAGLDENGLLKLTEIKNIGLDNLEIGVVDMIKISYIFSL